MQINIFSTSPNEGVGGGTLRRCRYYGVVNHVMWQTVDGAQWGHYLCVWWISILDKANLVEPSDIQHIQLDACPLYVLESQFWLQA